MSELVLVFFSLHDAKLGLTVGLAANCRATRAHSLGDRRTNHSVLAVRSRAKHRVALAHQTLLHQRLVVLVKQLVAAKILPHFIVRYLHSAEALGSQETSVVALRASHPQSKARIRFSCTYLHVASNIFSLANEPSVRLGKNVITHAALLKRNFSVSKKDTSIKGIFR